VPPISRFLPGLTCLPIPGRRQAKQSKNYASPIVTSIRTDPLLTRSLPAIELVNCHLDNRVYVANGSPVFALRTRQQMNPQIERQILLMSPQSIRGLHSRRGSKEKDECWTPRMLCAYQSQTHLNIIMEYAEAGLSGTCSRVPHLAGLQIQI